MKTTYIYDKRAERIVEKPVEQLLPAIPFPVEEWWADYLRMVEDFNAQIRSVR